jgi:hypothetical protein
MTATPPNYSGEVNADFSYSIKFPKVTFRDGDLVGPDSARVRVVVTATPQGGGTPVRRTLKLKLRRI